MASSVEDLLSRVKFVLGINDKIYSKSQIFEGLYNEAYAFYEKGLIAYQNDYKLYRDMDHTLEGMLWDLVEAFEHFRAIEKYPPESFIQLPLTEEQFEVLEGLEGRMQQIYGGKAVKNKVCQEWNTRY